jgi:hypothetical protein
MRGDQARTITRHSHPKEDPLSRVKVEVAPAVSDGPQNDSGRFADADRQQVLSKPDPRSLKRIVPDRRI